MRHLVARDNLTAHGTIADAHLVRHGSLTGRRIAALAGPIDPRTHLNLDFPGHQLQDAVVVERLEIGAPVVTEADGFRIAAVEPGAFTRRGWVDFGVLQLEWQLVLRRK